MRICHFSDWHGDYNRKLPSADLYICTGDMLPNFPITRVRNFENGSMRVHTFNRQLVEDAVDESQSISLSESIEGQLFIDKNIEVDMQNKFVKKNLRYLRNLFGCVYAPVICVRGNHDFVNISPLFGGEAYELAVDEYVGEFEVLNKRFAACRGMPYLAGEWSDELYDAEFNERAQKIDAQDVDFIVSHVSPKGILDNFFDEHIGSNALNGVLNRATYDDDDYNTHSFGLKAWFFGHCHNQAGITLRNNILFSNAACTFNVIEV